MPNTTPADDFGEIDEALVYAVVASALQHFRVNAKELSIVEGDVDANGDGWIAIHWHSGRVEYATVLSGTSWRFDSPPAGVH